jgi:restriction system protein
MAGPSFVKYFPYVISALKKLGNSGTPAEVREIIALDIDLTDDDLNETISSGSSRFENQVAWARFYLSKTGYLDSSKRRVWSLTEKALSSNVTEKEALKIFKEAQIIFKGKEHSTLTTVAVEETVAPSETTITGFTDYRTQILDLVRSLPPAGFEKLCQRLLREAGFQQVDVTGRSGDGGIDGKGLLQINRFLSIQVVFQSKRYSATTPITVSQIRDLRGAMAGRTDKGIFITTSSFTTDARKEALREGVPPIELVDGNQLVVMLEDLELGLIPRKVFEVDQRFFDEFR